MGPVLNPVCDGYGRYLQVEKGVKQFTPEGEQVTHGRSAGANIRQMPGRIRAALSLAAR